MKNFYLLPLLLTLSACGSFFFGETPLESRGIATNDIYASIEAVSYDGITTDIEVELKKSSIWGDTIDLVDGDYLDFEVNGNTTRFSRRTSNGAVYYFSTVAYSSTAAYTINLHRSIELDAPGTVIVVPEVFELINSPDGASYTEGDSLTIQWEVLEKPDIDLFYTSDCSTQRTFGFGAGGKFINNTGLEEILVSEFVGDYDEPASCNIQITLSYVSRGYLSPEFKSGYAKASQSREFEVYYSMP